MLWVEIITISVLNDTIHTATVRVCAPWSGLHTPSHSLHRVRVSVLFRCCASVWEHWTPQAMPVAGLASAKTALS